MKRYIIFCIGSILAMSGGRDAMGVSPMIWRDDTFKEFEKGETKGVSVAADGSISLSPTLGEYADTEALHVWSLARDRDGVLYVGTGNRGEVFKVSLGSVDLLGALPGAKMVHALAVDPSGTVYAGVSPGGAIYKIPPGKTPAFVCSTGTRYVWALTFTGEGELYAATGGAGKILHISPDGKIREVGSSSDEHIVALVSGTDGGLYAGTEGSGLVYRISREGRMQVLYDSPGKEVRGLALSRRGVLFAGSMTGALRLEEGKIKPQISKSGSQGSGEGSDLYRISRSGSVLHLWASDQPLLLSMLIDEEDNLLVATGDRGILYRVGTDGEAAVVTRFEEGPPLVLINGSPGEVFIGAGSSGKVFRMSKEAETEGSLTSHRYDFGTTARWGKVSWRAGLPVGTAVVLQTRSGNVESSDEGWSGWSSELKDQSGSQIESPPGRFLQYRARLTSTKRGVSPVLREVSLAGLQENLRPGITSLEVIVPGRSTPSPDRLKQGNPKGGGDHGSKPIEKRNVQIQWAAKDPNHDELSFSIFVRGVDESTWRLLEKDLRTTSYSWDTESTPDGTALVKVVASDRLHNPEPLALSVERLSEPFEVDNTPPSVIFLKALKIETGVFRVSGSASDATSPLMSGDYAIDSGEWNMFFPADGIFDSREERFGFKVNDLPPGEHVVLVRITDGLGNIGVGKTMIRMD